MICQASRSKVGVERVSKLHACGDKFMNQFFGYPNKIIECTIIDYVGCINMLNKLKKGENWDSVQKRLFGPSDYGQQYICREGVSVTEWKSSNTMF